MLTLTLNRRQFVALGSVTMAGMAASLPLHGAALPGSFVSVGYTAGRTRLRIGGRGSSAPSSFIDAATLPGGNPEFFRSGAGVRLHGFTRSTPPPVPERIDVDLLFPIAGEADAAPFHAFSSVAGGGREMTASPVRFTVPAESTGAVALAIERRVADASQPGERIVIPMTVNDLGGSSLKLTDGLYAIAMLRPGDRSPDWPAIRTDVAISPHRKEAVHLVHDVFGETVPVGFDYFLLSVAAADASEEPAVGPRSARSAAAAS